ncbi:bifunctional pyridoxamine 5'-phosphate oxidase family protein/GNAT family N-acetyltransferase [Micromonospora sp. NPDC048999]|uniref:bifunctional pyridoxamine 5'-phosphate oxidase family protein/GNAT family N-acetyltransferase n=1 Tax=Micromonospora sp. NPDC048999 TaxID=3155391 RepID=UPI0033F7B6E9
MYPRTERTTATRMRDRMSYDEATAHAVLDEAYHSALSFVVDGEPRVLPTLHVRVGDTLYLHGSTGSRPLLAARGGDGLAICVAVTHIDGLVLARAQFNHSANYRSVVVHGTARLVTDEQEKRDMLTALVDKVAAGRSTDSRPPTRRELAETAVLALPLREVSVRTRVGGVNDEPADLDLPYWAGVVPLRLTAGVPEPDAGVDVPVPAYLRPARSPWLEPVVLRGAHVVLEPLDLSHAEELYAALDDPEVWRYVGSPRPTCANEMAGLIRAALADHERGVRVPWVQRSAATGAVVGTTSYYQPDEGLRTMEIGFTQLGRAWWRTGINTEAKLLLLTRAFEELAAIRVTWQTSTLNERSQRAIERLGATREGTLRSNRRRADGSWRDSALYSMLAAEWPNAQLRLRERLRPTAPVAS